MSAAILMLLVFADLSSLSLGGANDSSSGGSSAAGRTVQDTAKAASESANGPQAQPVAPRPAQPVPGTAGGNAQQGFGPSPVPQAASAPPAAGTPAILTAPAAIQPATGSPAPAIAGGAAQVPTPTNSTTIRNADEADKDDDDSGLSTLRILEIVAALVLAGSLVGLYMQRHRGT
jgi:hypothetical protein